MKKYDYKNVELTRRNRMRASILVILSMQRFINAKFNNSSEHRIDLLRTFSSYYETVNPTVEKWIFASIKTVYLNILKFENINLNLKDLKIVSANEANLIYLQLETRIKGVLEALVSNSKKDIMEFNILKLLSIMITKGSYLPYKFFTLFELCRINTINSQIM